MRIKTFFLLVIIILWGSTAYSAGEEQVSNAQFESGKVFLYTGKRLGVPIFKASIRIANGSLEHGKPLYQIEAYVDSLSYLGFLFRMNNHFVSTIERETFSPIRYVKEIDQEGLLIQKKRYVQISTFDSSHQKVVVEKQGEEGKQEISIPPGTYDPLSIFARYYLREELLPGQDIQISLFDGKKLHQMVFHSRKEKVNSKIYEEVEAICVESTTSFSTFGDKEGRIRIWYTTDGKKIPISMELDLPIGSVKFELDEVKES